MLMSHLFINYKVHIFQATKQVPAGLESQRKTVHFQHGQGKSGKVKESENILRGGQRKSGNFSNVKWCCKMCVISVIILYKGTAEHKTGMFQACLVSSLFLVTSSFFSLASKFKLSLELLLAHYND